jgi:hypothetical protein
MCLVGFDGTSPANLDRIWRLLLDQVNSKTYKRGGNNSKVPENGIIVAYMVYMDHI